MPEKPSRFHEVQGEFPLAPGWVNPALFHEEFTLDSFKLQLVGVSAELPGRTGVVGASASPRAMEIDRAWFELLERTTIVDYLAAMPERLQAFRLDGTTCEFESGHVFHRYSNETCRPSYSNAVAASTRLGYACRSAYMEMVERDQVLRCWLGRQNARVSPLENQSSLPLTSYYRLHRVDFSSIDCPVQVCGVFGIPLDGTKHPLLCGFGAAENGPSALEKAIGEVSQRLGFLMGEEIPSATPPFRVGPDYHQEWALSPEGIAIIEAWLLQGTPVVSVPANPRLPTLEECFFVDISPAHLIGKVFVVKAFHPAALPLYFGKLPEKLFGKIAPERLIHPIA